MLPHHREICDKLKPSPGPHILTGPIAVRGAEPGDTLEVRIKAIELTVDWGWNLIRPLRGTLPEDYPEFRCRIIPIDRSAMTAKLPWGPSIPLSPFFGIHRRRAAGPSTGRAPRSSRASSAATSTTRNCSPAPRSIFPVFVPGANFSAGDGHAVQGDGEVCLTALETCLKGTFEFVLHKGMTARHAACRHADASHHHGASIPTSTTPPSRRCAT